MKFRLAFRHRALVSHAAVVAILAASLTVVPVIADTGLDAARAVSPAPTSVSLSTSSAVVARGATATLVAQADRTLTDTGYVLAIYDTTTGTRLGFCDSSFACDRSVSWEGLANADVSETAHQFQAFVEHSDGTGRAVSSNVVASAQQAFTVTLTASKSVIATNETAALSADVNQSVSSSGFVIAIYDTTTSTRLGFCDTLMSCGQSVSWAGLSNADNSASPHLFKAYVEKSDGTGRRASSATVGVAQQAFTPTLTSSNPVVATDQSTTLSATSNQSVSGTSRALAIYDLTTGARLANCTVDTTCSATVTWAQLANADGSETAHVFKAFVEKYDGSARRESPAVSSAQRVLLPVCWITKPRSCSSWNVAER